MPIYQADIFEDTPRKSHPKSIIAINFLPFIIACFLVSSVGLKGAETNPSETQNSNNELADPVKWLVWHLNNINRHFHFNYNSATLVKAGSSEKTLTEAEHNFSGSGEFWDSGFEVEQAHRFGTSSDSYLDYQAAGSFSTNSSFLNWVLQNDDLTKSQNTIPLLPNHSMQIDNPIALHSQSLSERLLRIGSFYIPTGVDNNVTESGAEIFVHRLDRNVIPLNGALGEMGRMTAILRVVSRTSNSVTFRREYSPEIVLEVQVNFKLLKHLKLVPDSFVCYEIRPNSRVLRDRVSFTAWEDLPSKPNLEIYTRLAGLRQEGRSFSYSNNTFYSLVGTNTPLEISSKPNSTLPQTIVFIIASVVITLAAVLAKNKILQPK
jgi:hypothetical protein